jgi:hypothetical protein
MSKKPPPAGTPKGGGDPWSAFGYLVAGVGLYGLLGWGLGTWLHASYLTPIGILVGAGLGLVMTYYQLARPPGPDSDARTEDNSRTHNSTKTPEDPPPGRSHEDRGDTE